MSRSKALRDHEEEMVFIQRLGQKIVGACFHGSDSGIDRGMGGHDDYREIFGWSDFWESLEDLKVRSGAAYPNRAT